jgi:hypothetical protein
MIYQKAKDTLKKGFPSAVYEVQLINSNQIPNLWVPTMYQHCDSKYTIDEPEDYKKHLNDAVPLRNVYAWAYGNNLSVAINTVPVYRHIHELSEKLERKLELTSKSKECLQSIDF